MVGVWLSRRQGAKHWCVIHCQPACPTPAHPHARLISWRMAACISRSVAGILTMAALITGLD